MRQFLRYSAIGALATVVHYLLLVLCVERGGWQAWWGSGFGAVAGAQVAYLGNRWFTVRDKGELGRHFKTFKPSQ